MQTVEDVMTRELVTAEASTTLADAAKLMRDAATGDVLVTEKGRLIGLVTDRDLAVRGLAEGKDPLHTPVADVCSPDPVCVRPEDSVEAAVRLMGDRAVRRLPVVDEERPLGVVSLGDLAQERDPGSALGRISQAEPNT